MCDPGGGRNLSPEGLPLFPEGSKDRLLPGSRSVFEQIMNCSASTILSPHRPHPGAPRPGLRDRGRAADNGGMRLAPAPTPAPELSPLALAAGDLARAASAVVCTPVAYALFALGTGEPVEAFHGLSPAEAGSADGEAIRAFARLAMLQTDPLAIADLATAPGLPAVLDHERIQWRWCGGVPHFAPDGRIMGVVCVFDRVARSGGKPALERLAALVRGFDPHAHDGRPRVVEGPEEEIAFATLAFLAGGVARELEERLGRIAQGAEALRGARGNVEARGSAAALSRDAARALELIVHLRALVEAREAD